MSLFAELKRRNVFRVGVAYAVGAWLLLQLTEVLSELLNLPEEIGPIVVAVVAIGFPIALFFAWAYEMTPQGIKREKDVDRSQSITQQTGRKLDRAIIALLAVALAYFVYESRFMDRDGETETADLAPATASSEADGAVTAPATEPQATSVAVDEDAIAVLPFANRSLKEEDLFFTDGIHDDLLTQLAKIAGLKVISRTSVMEYRDTTKKIPEIADELGVGKILEGGVQRAGNRVRINAQLIDVNTDQHLWAETFDREMTIDNIFDIQSEITRQIVTAVKGELTAADEQNLGGRPTDSLAAWEAWLHAENIVAETDYTADKYQRAEPFARKAVEEDPGFADAWITLATIQMQGIWIGFENTEEQRERVRQNLARAEAIAPNSPNVKAAQADYHYRIELDYERCLELLEEALELAPGVAELHRDLGLALRRLGRWEESVAAFERTLELDPLNSFAAATLAETLALMNDWARLEPLVDRWLTRDPDSGDLLGWKADTLIFGHGDLDTAATLIGANDNTVSQRFLSAANTIATLRRDWDMLLALNNAGPDLVGLGVFDLRRSYRLGLIHAGKGEVETARDHLNRYIEEARLSSTPGRVARAFRTMNMAVAHALLGNADTALALAELASTLLPLEDDHVFGANIHKQNTWLLAFLGQRDAALERIAAKLDQPEGFSRWQLYLEPRWDFLRDDPRFNDLARPEGVEVDPFRDPSQGGGT